MSVLFFMFSPYDPSSHFHILLVSHHHHHQYQFRHHTYIPQKYKIEGQHHEQAKSYNLQHLVRQAIFPPSPSVMHNAPQLNNPTIHPPFFIIICTLRLLVRMYSSEGKRKIKKAGYRQPSMVTRRPSAHRSNCQPIQRRLFVFHPILSTQCAHPQS